MKRLIILLSFLCFSTADSAAATLPETLIDYDIEVTFEPETRKLSGKEVIQWQNPGQNPVDAIPLHLYLNAFSHGETTWMRGSESRRRSTLEKYERYDDPWGYMEPTQIRVGSETLPWKAIAPDDGNPLDRSLILVPLTEPLPPGEAISLEIEFDAQLPIPAARTGGELDFFMVAQWFPKVAVYETQGIRGREIEGFNAHQFHGATEFYADFADFDVTIDIPEGWSLVATGRQHGAPNTNAGRVVHHYQQRAVHDFAWSVGREYGLTQDFYGPGGQETGVELTLLFPPGLDRHAERGLKILRYTLDYLSTHIGPYPYDSLDLILPPGFAKETSGMEYPTLVLGTIGDPLWENPLLDEITWPEVTIAHEVAHQYFYGVIASNEFEEAFLDEGFTEYWEKRVLEAYVKSTEFEDTLLNLPWDRAASLQQRMGRYGRLPRHAVLQRPSYLVDGGTGFYFYRRPAGTMMTLGRIYGVDAVDAFFQDYYRTYQFQHPNYEDMLRLMEAQGPAGMAAFLHEAYSQEVLPDFRIESAKTEPLKAPDGRVIYPGETGPGPLEAMSDGEAQGEEASTPTPYAPPHLESMTNHQAWVEIRTPGSGRGEDEVWGGIQSTFVDVEQDEAAAWEDKGWHRSQIRVAGERWKYTPTRIELSFEDGAKLSLPWDGRAAYRQLDIIYRAPLVSAAVDPDNIYLLDPQPENNHWVVEGDEALVEDFSLFMGALGQWIVMGALQWF